MSKQSQVLAKANILDKNKRKNFSRKGLPLNLGNKIQKKISSLMQKPFISQEKEDKISKEIYSLRNCLPISQ